MNTDQTNRTTMGVQCPRCRVRWFESAVLISLLLSLAAPGKTAAAPGPIACWSGDGDAQDRCSTNHGTLLNGTGYGPGKIGEAFTFDGVDDCISIGQLPELQGAREITVAAWVLKSDWTPQPGVGAIVGKWQDGGNADGDNTFLLFDGQSAFSQQGVFCVWFETGGYDRAETVLQGYTVALRELDHRRQQR